MAFSFGNQPNQPMASQASGGVQNGTALEAIQTEGLGYLALAGDAKVQLLPTSWPTDKLPPPTSSLMSIASRKGLIAAAGPDAVIVAKTKSVRKAFEGAETGDNNMKPFRPELTIPMNMRVSQLAFSADESYLVLSAEDGGGLAVYDVDALLNGATQSAFELTTNGLSLRSLIPNPTAEKGELFAVVTVDGKFMMANLKERSFVSAPNGQVLKDGVSCISWSAKGKQLVAGLGDGSVYQTTPEGVQKGEIPRLPDVAEGNYVSSITWLENHVFLITHYPAQSNSALTPEAVFHVVTRHPAKAPDRDAFTSQKIEDPAGPFGFERLPPHNFILRLRDFKPNLQDVLIVTSTAAMDVGLFTRSTAPLASSKPITGDFTLTEFADDSKRAQLPTSSGMGDTSAIGLALDLSSDEKVVKPIPGDEIDESPTPLPAVMLLNHEGALAGWWFVYNDSIRQGTAYSGLIAAGGGAQATQPTTAPAQPAFGGSAFNNTPLTGSGFAGLKPAATPVFGAPATSGSSTGAFGATSGLGQKPSPWGAQPGASQTGGAFGAPAFGAAATLGGGASFGKPAFGATNTPAFGASGLPGRQSVWGTGGTPAPQAAFGQVGGIAKPSVPFGASTNAAPAAPATGGFASFASNNSKGGFAAVGAKQPAGGIFGKPSTDFSGTPGPTNNAFGNSAKPEDKPTNSIFGQTGNKPSTGIFGSGNQNGDKPTPSIFGGGNQTGDKPTPSIFGRPSQPESQPSIFGGGKPTESTPFGAPSGFSLGTTFKATPTTNEPETNEPKSSFFGSGFTGALGDTGKKPAAETSTSKEADMDSDETVRSTEPVMDSTTPSTTPAPSKLQQFATSSASTGLFGTTPSQPASTTPKPASTGFSFGQPPPGDKPLGLDFSNLNKSTVPAPKTPISTEPEPPVTISETPATPKIKTEPESNENGGIHSGIPDAPLPPESTSKTSYAAGESSDSSFSSFDETDSPLPSGSTLKPVPKSAPSPPAPEPSQKPIPNELIPPMDVPGGPEDEGGSSDFLTGDDDNSQEGTEEGSGEDISKDLSPTSESNQTPGFTPQGSFNTLKKESSSGLFQKIEKPSQPPPRTLFGEGSLAPALPPPKPKVPLSPRSPSPVRGAIPHRMQRPESSRSVSAPGAASQILGQRPGIRPPSSSGNTLALAREQHQAEEKRRQEARAQKEKDATRVLVDQDDDNLQAYLAEDPLPTRTLVEFVAHSEHDSLASVDSIPAQVEAVYRDINSMIDNLGVNAKHLRGFIEAHTDQYQEGGRKREDLENEEDWVLVETEALSSMIERTLARDLENGRVKDVAEKLETCNGIQKDLIRLQAKHDEIKRIIDAQRDPSQVAQARAQPLSAEQLAQQMDLRQEYTKFQLLLSEAEEGLTLLKTKIVSQATSNERSGSSAAPTVEAVMRTITKMTSMAEKRSGDIDVLEGQMRKLRFSSTVSAGSREGTPFTPQASRQSIRNPGTSSTYGLFYTPDSTRDTSRNMRDSILSNSSSFGMSSPAPRKKLSGYTPEEKAQLRGKLAKRKEVVDKLKAALQKSGSSVRLMDDKE